VPGAGGAADITLTHTRSPTGPSQRWRAVLATAGLAVLAAVVYGTGIRDIWRHIAALGWAAPLILVPSTIRTLVDAAALGVALPRGHGTPHIPLMRLNLLRLAGEAINDTTPTGYLGGEPVKAHLITRYGVATTDAVVAVMVAKTAIIASQIVFVVMGLAMYVLNRQDLSHPVAAAAALAALGLAVIFALVEAQRRGVVTACARLAAHLFPRSTLVTRLSAHARGIDDRLAVLYGQDFRVFLASSALHFAGWLIGVAEVCLILALIGVPVGLASAFIIESLSGTIRALSFLIPATIGVQEVGGAVICQMVGVAGAPGMTLMLLKRAREFVFVFLGLMVLAPHRRRG